MVRWFSGWWFTGVVLSTANGCESAITTQPALDGP